MDEQGIMSLLQQMAEQIKQMQEQINESNGEMAKKLDSLTEQVHAVTEEVTELKTQAEQSEQAFTAVASGDDKAMNSLLQKSGAEQTQIGTLYSGKFYTQDGKSEVSMSEEVKETLMHGEIYVAENNEKNIPEYSGSEKDTIYVPITNKENETTGVVIGENVKDIEKFKDYVTKGIVGKAVEGKINNSQKEIQAEHDALTGLYNKNGYARYLQEDVINALQNDETVSMILIDGDKFKDINETYGHEAGDAVLKAISETMQKYSGENACVARDGGDEFLIILPCDGVEAYKIGENIRHSIEEMLIPTVNKQNEEVMVQTTISAGITEFAPENPNKDNILNQFKESKRVADERLSNAKGNGQSGADKYGRAIQSRNVIVASPEIEKQARESEQEIPKEKSVLDSLKSVPLTENVNDWVEPDRNTSGKYLLHIPVVPENNDNMKINAELFGKIIPMNKSDCPFSVSEAVKSEERNISFEAVIHDNGDCELFMSLPHVEFFSYSVSLTNEESEKIREMAENAVRERTGKSIQEVLDSAKEIGQIKDFLEEEIQVYCGNQGVYLPDFRENDCVSQEFLLEKFNEYQEQVNSGNDSHGSFNAYFDDQTKEMAKGKAEVQLIESIIEDAGEVNLNFQNAVENYLETNENALQEAGLQEIDIPSGSLTDREYYLNLVLQTGTEKEAETYSDTNAIREFYGNCLLDGQPMDNFQIECGDDNALTYLIHQQEHTVQEVAECLCTEEKPKNPFIEEVAYELKETHDAGVESPKMNATVFAKGDEVMDILNKVAHGEDYLEISENTKLRLSEYSFGITPETTMVFPTSMVEAVHGAEDYIHDCGEISVGYDAPVLVEENLNDVREYIEEQNQNHDMQKG